MIEKMKYWGQILLMPFYWLCILIPRSKKIWLFGSTFGRRFADNPRYFYLYMNRYHADEIKSVWISRDKEIVKRLNRAGYPAYYSKSLKGRFYCLRAKVYIFDNYSKDISFWLSNGAKKINLWHGIPLKKIQADNIFDKVRHPETKWDAFKSIPRRLSDEKPSHYVLTTSRFLKGIFSSAFRTKNVLVSGYPRNDVLISDKIPNILMRDERALGIRIKEQIKDGKMMVYYMPTFRESETKFFDVLNLKAFDEFLARNNILFCTKLHPKSKLREEFEKITTDNILNISADADPYVFLRMADVLVTDYSSVYFDFLLRDKPIVFFNYDMEEYLSNSREMYFNYESFAPGEKADNQKKFQRAIVEALRNEGLYKKKYDERRRRVREKVFDETKSISGPRLYKDIKRILKGERL